MNPPPLEPDALAQHVDSIRRVAYGLLGDEFRAEDAAQEAMLAALEHRPSADKPLGAWLNTVTRNFALQFKRSDNRRSVREASQAGRPELPGSDELVERAEANQQLVQALLRIREPYRTTLLLHYFENVPAKDIATNQGIPAATVRTHLKRGLEQLRQQFDQEQDWRALCLMIVGLPPTAVAAPQATEPEARTGEPTSNGSNWLPWALTASLWLAGACGLYFWNERRVAQQESDRQQDPSQVRSELSELGYADESYEALEQLGYTGD